MQQPTNDNPWGQEQPPRRGFDVGKRAAIVLWIIAALQLALSGCCCGFGMLLVMQTPEAIERAAAEANVPTQDLLNLQQYSVLMMVMVFGLVVLPAITYLVLAFGVRKSNHLAANVTLLVAMTQAIVLGVLLLFGIVEGVRTGNPANLTVNVLFFGSALALLIYAIRLLMVVRRSDGDDTTTDPWNS